MGGSRPATDLVRNEPLAPVQSAATSFCEVILFQCLVDSQ